MNVKLPLSLLILSLAIFAGLAGGGLYFLYGEIVEERIKNGADQVVQYTKDIEERAEILAGGYVGQLEQIRSQGRVQTGVLPLTLFNGDDQINGVALAREGIITWTNQQRAVFGLPPLKQNQLLDVIAEAKVDDMFARQYFAHISPAGIGIADLAVDYDYAVIGENLARGLFADEGQLVMAWMGSPGHRANILNSAYREIGVASRVGNFAGQEVVLAVQVFAKHRSLCTEPNDSLRDQIEANQQEIDRLENVIAIKQAELNQPASDDRGTTAEMTAAYNELVNSFNNLIQVTEASISAYNKEVQAYNHCLNY